MTPADRFAKLLRNARAEKQLSQSELAERAGMPVHSLQNYEAGRREPKWSAVCALATAMKLPLERFRF